VPIMEADVLQPAGVAAHSSPVGGSSVPIIEPDELQPAGVAAHISPVGGSRVPIMEADVLQPAGVAAAVLQLQRQAAAVVDLGSSVMDSERIIPYLDRCSYRPNSVLTAHLFLTLGEVKKVWLKLGRWFSVDSAPAYPR
jgi:hypothetical protein